MTKHHAHHAGAHVIVFIVVHIDQLHALAALENDAGAIAPAEHRLGVPRLVVGMSVREAKGLVHGVLVCPLGFHFNLCRGRPIPAAMPRATIWASRSTSSAVLNMANETRMPSRSGDTLTFSL